MIEDAFRMENKLIQQINETIKLAIEKVKAL
jgi:hypothetical protein